jgi:ketosteroid isomerase-like protein
MKRYLLFIILAAVVIGCAPKKDDLTADQVQAEKDKMMQVIKDYNKAIENKNFSAVVETLASEVYFFGTDSTEVIKTFRDYKAKIKEQWEKFDKTQYGDPEDVYIEMDPQAQFANIIFGIPMDITVNGGTAHLYLRMSRNMKKEAGKWVISSGIISNLSSEQGERLEQLLQNKQEGIAIPVETK